PYIDRYLDPNDYIYDQDPHIIRLSLNVDRPQYLELCSSKLNAIPEIELGSIYRLDHQAISRLLAQISTSAQIVTNISDVSVELNPEGEYLGSGTLSIAQFALSAISMKMLDFIDPVLLEIRIAAYISRFNLEQHLKHIRNNINPEAQALMNLDDQGNIKPFVVDSSIDNDYLEVVPMEKALIHMKPLQKAAPKPKFLHSFPKLADRSLWQYHTANYSELGDVASFIVGRYVYSCNLITGQCQSGMVSIGAFNESFKIIPINFLENTFQLEWQKNKRLRITPSRLSPKQNINFTCFDIETYTAKDNSLVPYACGYQATGMPFPRIWYINAACTTNPIEEMLED
ncbi:hypothetical protein HK100_009026, partial [Physocladia obscura]